MRHTPKRALVALALAGGLGLGAVPAAGALPALPLPDLAQLPGSIEMAPGSAEPLPGSATPAPGIGQPVSAQAIIAETNAFRARHGLAPLKADPRLNALAGDWSRRIAARGQLSHRPNMLQAYPAGTTRAAENVAMNGPSATAKDLVRQWANSPGHRRNMLDPRLTHMGAGSARAADGYVYATQNFARY
ncbi:CAP domain-containing protein [Corynebacterium sphenisci]|uniref:CAP domain-containing protein n=1 Tax=Corynebacterium sphenisci TaxID=191493 RepID=UPI0026DEBC74|nr:CAP domain-containing protein [Corynebacterium sphenisci]MDO5730654.1 CAP domain-containing protein [Corynebacterium sphenisci]